MFVALFPGSSAEVTTAYVLPIAFAFGNLLVGLSTPGPVYTAHDSFMIGWLMAANVRACKIL